MEGLPESMDEIDWGFLMTDELSECEDEKVSKSLVNNRERRRVCLEI